MKTLLATIAIGITTAASSLAGPSWGFSLGNGAGFSWNGGAPQCMPRPVHVYEQPRVVVTGPQYYRVHSNRNLGCNTRRIKNHMDAPLIVDYRNSGGRRESVVIPASWD